SLSYEMFFYIVMPVAVVFLRPLDGKRRMLAILAAAILIAIYCSLFGGHMRLMMFMSGMLVYESVKRGNAPGGALATLALVLGLTAAILPAAAKVEMLILFGSFYLFCLHCFVRPEGRLARVFTWTPLRRLGNMSYSYYLIHGLGLKAAFMVLPPLSGAMFLALLPVLFAWTLVPSVLLFLWVERPFSLAPAKAPRMRPVEASAV
ncbi:MAG: acyltransferase, partial [Oxalobacteraceae bacterium]